MILEYEPKDSLMHKLNVYSKSAFLILFIYVISIVYDIYTSILFLAITVLLAFLSKLPWKKLWARGLNVLTPLFIILGLTFMIVFSFYPVTPKFIPKEWLSYNLIPPISIGPYTIKITYSAACYGIILILRAFTAFFFTSILLYSTSPIDFITAMIKLRIPHQFGLAVMMAYCLVPKMFKMYSEVLDAQKCRGLVLKGNPIKKVRKLTPVIFPILSSVTSMSYSLGMAMESRAFGAGKWTPLSEVKFTLLDYVFLAIWILLGAVITILVL